MGKCGLRSCRISLAQSRRRAAAKFATKSSSRSRRPRFRMWRFADDFRKDLKATEEELKKRYEEQKELFKTAEERKVRYAAFLLPPPAADGKPLEGKERT